MKRFLSDWRAELLDELTADILPFWTAFCAGDRPFSRRVDGRGGIHDDTGMGAVLLARMLWFFAAAYRATGDGQALRTARRVRNYLSANLVDPRYGGVFWELSPDGTPKNRKKQSYAIGFAIYGLCEYAHAADEARAADEAEELFRTLERHAFDSQHGGYVEASDEDWRPIEDMRLSDKDTNTVFSMNTHLHLLEAYTALLRIRPSEAVADAVVRLLGILTGRIFDPATGHLGLFFDNAWRRAEAVVSYGHDIESSWLIDEAAHAAGIADPAVEAVVHTLAEAAAEGLRPDGSTIYEYDPTTRRTDADRHWWVQAESAVGYFNMYERTGDRRYLDRSRDAWRYISGHLINRRQGEWYWSIRADGSVNRTDDKAGFWKCPYHNGRMCLELMARIDRIAND